MYQSELDLATIRVLQILELDINSVSKVKYKELESYLNTLGMQQYCQGHDDGYSLHAGYKVK
jgi:hypothetical protein